MSDTMTYTVLTSANRYKFLVVTVCSTLISIMVHAENLSQRPMYVQKYEELNIEFLSEVEPLWNTKVKYHNRKPMLLVSTQPKVYPPMFMIVTSFPGMFFTPKEFNIAYDPFLETALANYGINSSQIISTSSTSKVYGDLEGREVDFRVNVHGTLSDIKVFLGMAEKKGPVLLQAMTLADKMSHLEGSLQRSWGNIRYLD